MLSIFNKTSTRKVYLILLNVATVYYICSIIFVWCDYLMFILDILSYYVVMLFTNSKCAETVSNNNSYSGMWYIHAASCILNTLWKKWMLCEIFSSKYIWPMLKCYIFTWSYIVFSCLIWAFFKYIFTQTWIYHVYYKQFFIKASNIAFRNYIIIF